MQSLDVGIFEPAEVKAALHSEMRYVDFRYELLTSANARIRDIELMISGAIYHNSGADVKRTARFAMNATENINWGKDRIRPWFRLRVRSEPVNNEGDNWVEWPLGVFLLSSPKRAISSTAHTRNVDAYDQGLVLMDDKSVDRTTIASGTNVIDAVAFIMASAGIDHMNLVPTSETLPVTMEWKPGVPKLHIINAMLQSINYWPVYFDSLGVAVARPYTQGAIRATEYTYTADHDSVLNHKIASELDLFDAPNKWVAHVSEPDRPPLRSEHTNTSPASPTSTFSRDRVILKVLDNVEATSQAILDQIVLREAEADNMHYERATIQTALMPHHEDNDLIAIDYDQFGDEPVRFVEESWEMTLKAGQLMTHVLKRLVRT